MILGCLNPKASCRHTCAGVPRSGGTKISMFFLMRWKLASAAGLTSHCERISYCFVDVLWHTDAKTWKPATSFVSWFGYVCFCALHAQFLLGATRDIWRHVFYENHFLRECFAQGTSRKTCPIPNASIQSWWKTGQVRQATLMLTLLAT